MRARRHETPGPLSAKATLATGGRLAKIGAITAWLLGFCVLATILAVSLQPSRGPFASTRKLPGMDEIATARAENEALDVQVRRRRWRARLPERLPALTLGRALRRILCPHNETGSMVDDDHWVWWCTRCGHTEVSLAPLAPDELLPEGRPAWNSAAVSQHFALIKLGLALAFLALVIVIVR